MGSSQHCFGPYWLLLNGPKGKRLRLGCTTSQVAENDVSLA